MKYIIRFFLRIPYFYYWSWKRYPYHFELWLSLYISYNLAKSPLKKFKVLVPKEYYELIKKYPNFNPFDRLKAGILKDQSIDNKFYHYEKTKG